MSDVLAGYTSGIDDAPVGGWADDVKVELPAWRVRMHASGESATTIASTLGVGRPIYRVLAE